MKSRTIILAAIAIACATFQSCEKESVNVTVDSAPVIASFSPKTAPAGAEVVVTGEYLHNVTSAYIGDVKVDIIQKVSNGRLSIKVGKDVTSGKVSLVNATGKGESSDVFTCSFAVPEITSSLLQSEAEMGSEVLITGKYLNSASSVVFTAEGYENGHEATIVSQSDVEIVVKVPYVESASANISMTYFDGTQYRSTDKSLAPITVIRYVPQIDSYEFTRTAVGKSITLTGKYLQNIDKIYVGTFEAQSFKSSESITFTIPAGDFEDGETTVVLKATYFDENESIVLKQDFLVYVPFVKFWENCRTVCQGRTAESTYCSFFSPETGIVYENAKWKTDLDPVALKYLNEQWASANCPKPGVVKDEDYNSVVPYFFFSSVSGNVLQLNSPANSNSQLKNFFISFEGTPSNDYRVPGGNTTLPGIPILTFRYLSPENATENELREKVMNGQIEKIDETLFPIDATAGTVAGIGMTSAKGGIKSSAFCSRQTSDLVTEKDYKVDAVFIVAYYSNNGYSAEAPAANIKRLGFLHIKTIDWNVSSSNDYRDSFVTFNCLWQKYDYDYSKL
ncbi:MAG: IPT/TIG domain-containing protein [Candidatus Cryptobacteroides sp.]